MPPHIVADADSAINSNFSIEFNYHHGSVSVGKNCNDFRHIFSSQSQSQEL